MINKDTRRYWDACAFVAMITKEAGRWEDCVRLAEEAENGHWKIVTSVLSIAESCRKKGVGILHGDRSLIEAFFERSSILLVQIDRPVAISARQHMFDYGLMSNDAIHLASAQRADCRTLYTYDDDLLRLNDKVPGLSIIAPAWEGQQPMSLVDRPDALEGP